MKKQPKSKSYALRIDAPLVEPLQKLKKQNRRSLNAEINAALEQWVALASKARRKPAKAGAQAMADAPKIAVQVKQAKKHRKSKEQVTADAEVAQPSSE